MARREAATGAAADRVATVWPHVCANQSGAQAALRVPASPQTNLLPSSKPSLQLTYAAAVVGSQPVVRQKPHACTPYDDPHDGDHMAVWQAAFHVFGMELLCQLDLCHTNAFFATFFRLPGFYWRGFLGSSLSSVQLLAFAMLTFAIAPAGIQSRLVAHLLTDPAGSYLIRAYLGTPPRTLITIPPSAGYLADAHAPDLMQSGLPPRVEAEYIAAS